MEPEQRARQLIDDLLHTAGWVVQGRADLNLGAGRGIAVREFAVRPGDAADLRFVDRQAVGVIEATTFGFTWTGVEEQSATYRMGLPAGIVAAREPLPFASESTGSETRFTNDLEPAARSRPVFACHRPETLAAWLDQAPVGVPAEQNDTLRARLRWMPPGPRTGVRDCQVEAITNRERSFAANHPRVLSQMTMGSGKTDTAVSSVYRLLKLAGARRILFLVDRFLAVAQRYAGRTSFQVQGGEAVWRTALLVQAAMLAVALVADGSPRPGLMTSRSRVLADLTNGGAAVQGSYRSKRQGFSSLAHGDNRR